MFCSNCGTKSAENAKFCASCGNTVGSVTPANKPAASRAKKVAPTPEPLAEPELVAAATETELPTKPASPIAKLTANKPLLIGASVVVVALIAALVLFVKPGGPTQANAAEYMVATSAVSYDADLDKKADFSGQILDECPVYDEITALFSSGTTWAEGGISSTEGDNNGFHLKQRIFEASSDADVASLKSLLANVAADSDCDSGSNSGTIKYSFDYNNDRSINDAFGVNLDGVAIDMTFELCISGCTTTESSILMANRGRVVELIEFGGDEDRIGDMREAVTALLKKFAG